MSAPGPVLPRHEMGVNSSAAGWQAACPCGWQSDTWYRAKNSAMREVRDHVRTASAESGARSRRAMMNRDTKKA